MTVWKEVRDSESGETKTGGKSYWRWRETWGVRGELEEGSERE